MKRSPKQTSKRTPHPAGGHPPDEPRSAAVPAASLSGVSPLGRTPGGTPRELAGEDAGGTTAGAVQRFNAQIFWGNSLPTPGGEGRVRGAPASFETFVPQHALISRIKIPLFSA